MSHIETAEIDLSQADIVGEIYYKYSAHDAAHSFKSLFIWKKDMELSIYTGNDIYAVKSTQEDRFWFFPVGSDEAKKEFIERLISTGERLVFEYVTEGDVSFLEKYFPGKFEIIPAPDNSEYIMDRQIMESLPGKHFAKDRGHVNKFVKGHELRTVDIHSISKDELLDITRTWDKNKRNYEEVIDRSATTTIISHMDELDLKGIAIIMDDEPYAVIAGFALDEELVDCCLQKCKENVQGLSYYLRQEYAKSHAENVRFFNWEEDLGVEGLRRAKELMRPVRMLDMYTGCLR
ncbi:DUF2156 domain-containing protein [Butyrivibrio sp. FCS014]|uniref:DUF2156 domain-containing protein n=1 Tax=Butyrivibrio sp. FCS014 TaxID=1408304 RepID=UPI0004631285|nr:phosphatidylglycerol lysyltransferase domain-containing protein [Butyrivibrio sp. FCS014]